MSRTGPFLTTALIIAAILPEIRGETPEMLPEPAAIASAVPAPLYRDPVYDGAADPVVVWNAPQRVWNIFYTQRRARLNLPGVEWGHGTEIGVAESRNEGMTWVYKGRLNLEHPRASRKGRSPIAWRNSRMRVGSRSDCTARIPTCTMRTRGRYS
ncbi:MAG: hypothetical protein ABSG53_15780 [Thermoguttaceae bacterium]|jgi:hypothetical protein